MRHQGKGEFLVCLFIYLFKSVAGCWNSRKANQDCFGEYYFVSVEFDTSVFHIDLTR